MGLVEIMAQNDHELSSHGEHQFSFLLVSQKWNVHVFCTADAPGPATVKL